MENIIIDEKEYQKIKILLSKDNDYFTKEELEKYGKISGEIQAKLT